MLKITWLSWRHEWNVTRGKLQLWFFCAQFYGLISLYTLICLDCLCDKCLEQARLFLWKESGEKMWGKWVGGNQWINMIKLCCIADMFGNLCIHSNRQFSLTCCHCQHLIATFQEFTTSTIRSAWSDLHDLLHDMQLEGIIHYHVFSMDLHVFGTWGHCTG